MSFAHPVSATFFLFSSADLEKRSSGLVSQKSHSCSRINYFLLSHQGEAVFPLDIPSRKWLLWVSLRLQDKIQKHSWKWFQKDLIPLLAPRQKWKTEEPEIKPDDVIFEFDKNAKLEECFHCFLACTKSTVSFSHNSMIQKVKLIWFEGRIYLRPFPCVSQFSNCWCQNNKHSVNSCLNFMLYIYYANVFIFFRWESFWSPQI